MAKFSAHAEPRAIQKLLTALTSEGIKSGSKIAIVTDHQAIEKAQRKLNGYGGIGRGYALNKLYEMVYDLSFINNIDITFYHIPGRLNPADSLSRNFGGDRLDANITKRITNDTALISLRCTQCALCEEKRSSHKILT